MVRQALRVGMVTVGVAAVWPTALAWAPTATPAPAVVLADAARVEPTATAHPPVPRDLASLWLVPDARPVPPLLLKNFTRAIELVEAESLDEARPLLAAPALAKTPVADYARYYTALIDLRRGEAARAREAFHAIVAARPAGVLGEWALVGEAMAAEQASDFPAAAVLYETLSKSKPEEPDTVLLGLARSLAASGNGERALQVYRDLYYGYPMSDVAAEARTQMLALGAAAPTDDARELARAEQLFTARRYADAQAAFEALSPRSGDDRELVALRIAECHHYLGRHRQAVAGLQPYLSGAKREAEARFFHLSSTRALGDHAGYVAAAAGAGVRLQDGRVDGRDAEQPGHALHRHRRRCDRGHGVRRLSRAVPAGQVRRPRGVAPRLVEVSRRRLRGRRRDLRSGRGQLPALRLPSELALLGRPRLREGQPDGRGPTPASSWCAPTISTPTTDASPACTSAPRTRRARRSARSPRRRPTRRRRRPAAERDRDPAADPVGRVPARRGRDPLRAAALHRRRRRSRRRGPGCSRRGASTARPSTR